MLTQTEKDLVVGLHAKKHEMQCRDREGTITQHELKDMIRSAWESAVKGDQKDLMCAHLLDEVLNNLYINQSLEREIICSMSPRHSIAQ